MSFLALSGFRDLGASSPGLRFGLGTDLCWRPDCYDAAIVRQQRVTSANGWAASLARPGRNVTGVFLDLPGFDAKSLQLLREAVSAADKGGGVLATDERQPAT